MRDYLAATRERVVVFDGSMGATLEQFDLSLERDYKLPGRAHEALVLNRPDVIENLHASMVEVGAEVVETDTFQASRLKLEEWGLGDQTYEINRKAAEIARKAIGEQRFVAGSIGPTGHLPASDDPTLGRITFRELVAVFEEQARGLDRRRLRPADHRDRAGHPRGQGRRVRRPRGVQAAPAAPCRSRRPSRCCPTAARCCWAPTSPPCWPRSRRCGSTSSASTARPGPRTCATRSASSASSARCPSSASRTPASRTRARTARRSSPRSPTRSPTRSASSSSATASRSSAAAAAPRRSTSRRSSSASAAARPASAPRRARRTSRR